MVYFKYQILGMSKMRAQKGFTILEVVVALVIMAIIIIGSAGIYISVEKLSRKLDYSYNVLNIAREVLEFGEAAHFGHMYAMRYYYPPATDNTLPTKYSCWHNGIITTEGYKLKEYRCFCPPEDPCGPNGYPHAFTYLGDIKTRGMVPKKMPDSVVISHYIDKVPDSLSPGNSGRSGVAADYEETVEISWQEEPTEAIKTEFLSVIPIRQVNDQLRLSTSEFWWE